MFYHEVQFLSLSLRLMSSDGEDKVNVTLIFLLASFQASAGEGN